VQLVNETWIDTHALEDMIAFAKPEGREPDRIDFYCCAEPTHGATYTRAPGGVVEHVRVVVCVGPAPGHVPPDYSWTFRTGRVELRGLDEAVLYILSHELQHATQGAGLTIEQMERNADAHACRVLRRYRRAGSALSPMHQPAPARCA
jgi:hypothetical protein